MLSIFGVRDYYSLPTIPSSWLSCMLTAQNCAIRLVQQSALSVCVYVGVFEKNTILNMCLWVFDCMRERKVKIYLFYILFTKGGVRKLLSPCVCACQCRMCARNCNCLTRQVFRVDTWGSSSADQHCMTHHPERETVPDLISEQSRAKTAQHTHTYENLHTFPRLHTCTASQRTPRKIF